MPDKPISFWRLLAYASPGYITGAILFPTMAIIPTFYAKSAGLSLGVIGTILVAGRFFDAITDPLIGYLSDITKSPLGHRKPWVLGGFLLAMVAVYNLFIPGQGVGIPYFMVWFLLLYLSFTMVDIPHRAWGTEISRDYNERSRISTFVGLSVQLGSLTFAIIPLLPLFSAGGYNPETLKFIGIFFVVLIPPIALSAVIWGPKGKRVGTEKPSIKGLLSSVKGNKPFMYFVAIYIVAGLGNGMFFALIYLYCDTYMELGRFFPYFLVAEALFSFVAMPVWLKIIYKFGKHKPWSMGNFVGAIILGSMAFFQPGESAFIPFLILVALRSISITCVYVVPMALLGDVIDYDILRTRVNRSANYFSVMTLLSKTNQALSGGIGFIIIGAFGYTAAGPNSDLANTGLVFTALILPAIMIGIASVMIWFFPINHHKQSIIRRRIESRAARAERDGINLD